MNRLDLIIDALESSVPKFDLINQDANWAKHNSALAEARELKDNYVCLKKLPNPVDDTDIDFFGEVAK